MQRFIYICIYFNIGYFPALYAQAYDSLHVSLTGLDVMASQTHGGDPAIINEAEFIIRNPTGKNVPFNMINATYVEGSQNDSGKITIKTQRKYTDLEFEYILDSLSYDNDLFYLHQDKMLYHGKTIPPHSMVIVRLTFRSMEASYSYTDLYRATQLKVNINGIPYSANAEWIIIRREPWR